MATRPKMFIGSSTERLELAREVHAELDFDVEVTLWTQGIFAPGIGFLEALATRANDFDFALIITDADDQSVMRGEPRLSPRDNVLFELGLFIGTLGRERVFFLHNRDRPPALPSDLAGVSGLQYGSREDGNLRAAVGPACQEIRRAVQRHGLAPTRRLARLDDAAAGVERVETQLHSMVRLLARSRKVEIDLIAAQFGAFIDPKFLAQMREDLSDLEDQLQRLEA